MSKLTVIQSLACEALWTALQERNVDKTAQGLSRDTPYPEARARLSEYVLAQPLERLPKLILPEFGSATNWTSGHIGRWRDVSEAGLRHDANKRAEQNRRCSEMPQLLDVNTSSDSCSKEASERSEAAERDDTTPKASDKPEKASFAFSPKQG